MLRGPDRRTLARLIVAGLAIPLLLITSEALDLGNGALGLLYVLAAYMPLVLAWICVVIFLAAAAACYLVTKAWPQAAVAILLPAAMLVIFGREPDAIPYDLHRAGAALHLAFAKAHYDRQVALIPSNEPRLKLFWFGSDFMTAEVIAYDDSDQIVRPWDKHSKAWNEHADRAELGTLCHAEPLWDHYYTAVIGC